MTLSPGGNQHHLARYVPLDEILAKPPTRVLRALRWFDWVSLGDLLLALDVEDPSSIGYAAYQQAVSQLVKRGEIEQRRIDGVSRFCEYRITPSGLADLQRRYARAA